MNLKWLLLSAAVVPAMLLVSSFKNNRIAPLHISPSDTTHLPAFSLAKDHKGTNATITSGAITLTSGLDNDYYQLDSINRNGYLYIETKMGRFVNDAAKKTPLNLAIVIDRSGSMSGEKMEFAKKAAKGIIEKLEGNDYVSIVIYDDVVDVLQPAVPASDKAAIYAKVDQIFPRNGTNLWGGSLKGYEQLKASFKKEYVNRILLISDGLANAGITDPALIKLKVQQFKDNEGITISTFGIGLNYNEILMTDMAEAGSGNYYFIDKAATMSTLFDKELNGLLHVVAREAELHITLPRGVTVTKVYPYKYEQKGAELVIKYRDLFSEEAKGVMIRFALDDYVTTELVFQSKLIYSDVTDNSAKSVVTSNKLSPVKEIDAYLTHFNKEVNNQVVLFMANENMEKAMLEADRGNYEAARRYTTANAVMINATGDSAKRGEELNRMNSLNGIYDVELQEARYQSPDSLQRMQKGKRADNYKLRNKKN